MAMPASAIATATPSAEAKASSTSSGRAGLPGLSASCMVCCIRGIKRPNASTARPQAGQSSEEFWQTGGAGTSSAAPSAIFAAMSRRIAIVEDEPAIRANYAEALRKHGFEVAAYAGRAEALAAMKTRLPDLALIDIALGSDVDGGFSLCRELRALSAALPIIFLTAPASDF